MSTIQIGHRTVGPGHPCYVIAEAGSNHNRDFETAKRLIDAAVEAGCDAVKFQTYSADTLYSKRTPRFTYLAGRDEDTWDIIRKAELPREWQKPLFDYATAKGIHWLSTPTDRAGVDELDAIGVPAFKISSYEAVDLPFVRYVASKGRPMIISTGMCTAREIGDVYGACWDMDNDAVAFLQCASLYPAPCHIANLRFIPEWSCTYDGLLGYSDHTLGWHIPLAAVAMGACIIEKHFTLDRTSPGPDHAFALEPGELKAMVSQIRDVEAAMGDGDKTGPAPEEQDMYLKARRSVVSACYIPSGTVITAEMLTSKRPGHGIPAKDITLVVGRVAKADIPEDEVVEWRVLR